jgi:ABC-2 type transport system permease protein
MRIIDLALKDLLQIIRDWRAAFFLLIMPVAFTIMFGFAFGGFGDDQPSDSRLPVGLIDNDQGEIKSILASSLENSQIIRIEALDMSVDEAGETVADGELAAVVVVPPGYGDQIFAGNTMPLHVIADSGSDAGRTVQGEIQAIAMRLRNSVTVAVIGSEFYKSESGDEDKDSSEQFKSDTLSLALNAWETPPIGVVILKGTVANDEQEVMTESSNAFAQSSPGMMAQFTIAGLMGASAILVLERKSKAMRRLLTTAISRVEILLGHYLAMFVMIFVQLLILILFGQLLLKLDYFDRPIATLLLAVATALFAASLGLLIGSIAKTEEQALVFAMIPMFVLSGLGGAWVPLEITPEAFQQIARFTPLAFVMDGFQDIIIRGLDLQSISINLAVLLLYAIVLFGFAAWGFRYE